MESKWLVYTATAGCHSCTGLARQADAQTGVQPRTAAASLLAVPPASLCASRRYNWRQAFKLPSIASPCAQRKQRLPLGRCCSPARCP